MEKVFEDIYAVVWKEVFPNEPQMDVGRFQARFITKDFALPIVRRSFYNPSIEVHSGSEYGFKRFISREESENRMEIDNWMEEKKPVSSMKEAMGHALKVATFRGSRHLNSDVIEASDDIYSSSYVYGSTHIYSCQKVMFCYNNMTSEYLLASKGNKESSFSIRAYDSGGVANSFDIYWSEKVSSSYFCHDCFDIRDCMFCFHIVSKQYCIANMQFEKDEYFRIKEQILKDYFSQLDDPNGFRVLTDL